MDGVITSSVSITNTVAFSPIFATSEISLKKVNGIISANAADKGPVEVDLMHDDADEASRERKSQKSGPVAENGFVSAQASTSRDLSESCR